MSSDSPSTSTSSSKASDTPQISTVSPSGYGASSCGYCSPRGERSVDNSSFKVGMTALALTCADYQLMIDRGWRRSGTYCYKPDLRRSCCPQYTIRLDALRFQPSKSQRKIVNRWNKFIMYGDNGDSMAEEPKGRNKAAKKSPAFSLLSAIHASEASVCTEVGQPAHNFEVTLEPSTYTDEKYKLSCAYQAHVHDDEFSKAGFTRFLVNSCLTSSLIPLPASASASVPSHLPRTYGSYHQLYRVDGALIALAVLDILPGCVSSVYFMYDPRWERFSFGKLSAMREAALAREMYEAGATELSYLYMGFYVHCCPKMRYKGDYAPSFLLDPEECTWHALETCTKPLGEYRYACFAHTEHSLSGDDPLPGPPPFAPLHAEDVHAIRVYDREHGVHPLLGSRGWKDRYTRTAIVRVIEGLGWELAKRMVFRLAVSVDDSDEEEYESS